MVCQKVKIKNPAGLHLRPAGKLCDEAIKYKSKISFQRGTMITNVKSLLSVLAAGIKYNDERLNLSVREKMKKKRWQELY